MNFIKEIKIKNFFSIKDEIILNFEASDYTKENHKERAFKDKDNYYNKLISIYGANASGKTTLLKSLVVLGATINNEKSDTLPYSIKNKFAHANSKTELSVNFVVLVDGCYQEFQYELIFDANRSKINNAISNEILYIIKENKRYTFFNRKDRKITIDDIDIKTKDIIFDNIKPTISIFKEFEKFDQSSLILTSIKNFLGNIPSLTNINSAFFTTFGIKKEDEEKFVLNIINDEKLKGFIEKFLHSVGMDIDDIKVDFDRDEDDQIQGIKDILIYHSIDTKIPLEYKLESDGTKMLFKILIDVYLAKKYATVLVIDEFDSVLHSMLVPLLNKLIIDSDIQIFYTTHNIYNMKFLYADEIYIIEKDDVHKTHIKEPKKDDTLKGYENFLSLYENNYLGGLPIFENIFTKIDDDK
jgi:AAA15 family ATPase/GTPase